MTGQKQFYFYNQEVLINLLLAIKTGSVRFDHRYKKITDCLSFVVCPFLVPHLPRHFLLLFAAAINSTYEANKAGSTSH